PVRAPRSDELKLVVPHEVRIDKWEMSLDWRFQEAVDNQWLPRWRVVPSSPNLLSRFVALEHAPPEDVAAFARSFGVLGVCSHGQPAPHLHCGPVSKLDKARLQDPSIDGP